MEERPILLNNLPVENGIKHIKGVFYEAYLTVSDEIIHETDFDLMVQYQLRELRSHNYFVQEVYCKYRVPMLGATVFAFKLIKMKEAKFHHSLKTVTGSILYQKGVSKK